VEVIINGVVGPSRKDEVNGGNVHLCHHKLKEI